MNTEEFPVNSVKELCNVGLNSPEIEQKNVEKSEKSLEGLEEIVPKQESVLRDFFHESKTEAAKVVVKVEQGKNGLQCQLCDKVVQSHGHLKEHISSIHSINGMIKCTHCPRTFKYLWILKRHLVTHPEEKPMPCSICQTTFRNADDLKNHFKGHFVPKCYSCSDCDIKFQDKKKFKIHIQEVHTRNKSQAMKDNEKDPYTCAQCGKITWEFDFYQKHLATHSNKRPFKCTICSQSYKHSDSFKRHIGVHCKQKLFTCKVCSVYFAKKDLLVIHMKIHEKTIKCPYCDMAYSKKGYLEWHLETIHKGLPGSIAK
uniref:C2H2-type domain-containing protein n=1 Tax=Phlebotomus papatasi TaxID=29031 RepID=A0A1B0D7J4_PHLPP